MTAGSQFPDLDPDRVSGFWKQHFSSNTLRRVSVSLQSDKITQKTFKGREHHTEEERAKQRGYKGRQNVHYERISSFGPSPSVKEARTLALATIWALLPIPKLRGGPTWAPTVREPHMRGPSNKYTEMVGLQRLQHAAGTSMRCTHMAPRRNMPRVGRWCGRFLLPTYCWLGGDCSLSHVPSHCSLWRTRREKKEEEVADRTCPTSLQNVDAEQRAPLFVPL